MVADSKYSNASHSATRNVFHRAPAVTAPRQHGRTAKSAEIRNCSVERTVNILSDVWTFLVLTEIYLGSRRFDEIQAVLGLPRSTLSDRLGNLVSTGVLRRSCYSDTPARFEYRLTEMGRDLYLVTLSLLRFGDDWLSDGDPPLQLFHAPCGKACQPVTLCSACGGEIVASDVAYRDGPGAGTSLARRPSQRRRADGKDLYERGRPSSVARALRIIGDRWTFLVLREAFFGIRRYHDMQVRLGIAPNILADRLSRLIEGRIFAKRKYQESPERFEYRLTDMGRALFLPMIEMLRFGDRWLSEAPPLILTHAACGQDFLPVLSCDQCHQGLAARAMRYRLRHDAGPKDRRRHPSRIA